MSPSRTLAALPFTDDAPFFARQAARDFARAHNLDGRGDDVVAITSELVANAVVHGRSYVEVIFHYDDGDVRIDVLDGGTGTQPVRRRSPDGNGGRGLLIVETLASSWATHPTTTGIRVTATLHK